MACPTSRKKYYLELEIKPEWTDAAFLPDLFKFITSKSSQSVRDIFLANSERMGYFSVRSKDVSDKLIKSFSTNYISSGRKPKASAAQISKNNFQITLSNVNNIMSSKAFETWILSLNYNSFDIQLFPPKIVKPSNKCILSFDTINAAIFVKQKLENVLFRQFPLYFTHWHVPRRTKLSKSKPSKLGLTELQSQDQCCGYSTGASTYSNSPISSTKGPLFLRDSCVPPPPHRTPPAPPTQQADKTESDAVDVAKDPDGVISDCIINPVLIDDNLPQMAFMNSLHLEIKRLQLINSQLILENSSILSGLDEEKKYSHYVNDKYKLVYNNYINVCQVNKVLLWNVTDIIQWICRLENGWFTKYKDMLFYNMTQKDMNGAMLTKVTTIDLHRMGVIEINDQYLLLNHIKQLFSS